MNASNASDNIPTSASEAQDAASQEEEAFVARVMSITLTSIGGATVIMNVFVLILIGSFKSMRSNANLLIASMAVTDLMAGVCTIGAGTLKWADWFQLQGLLCDIMFALDAYAALCSLAHVFAVNLERYLAIVFPLHYKNMVSMTRLKIFVAAMWFVCLVESIAFKYSYEMGVKCLLVGVPYPGMALGVLLIAIAVPFISVVGIYIHIVIVVIRKFKFMAKTSNLDQQKLARSQRKMFVTVSLILLAWIICWLPLMCTVMAMNVSDAFNVPINMEQVMRMVYYIEVMSYGNSLLNPILYFLTSQDFRKAARTLLFRCSAETDDGDGNSSSLATQSTAAQSTHTKF